MKKRSLCKINFSRIFFRAKYSKYISILLLVFYIGLEACTTRQSKDTTSSDQESVTVNIQIPSGGTDGVLSVNRTGEQLDWRGDTLACLSWWDPDGKEQSEAVAEVNGWTIEKTGTDHNYRIECRREEMGFSFAAIISSQDSIMTVNIPASEIKEDGEPKIKSFRLLPNFGAGTDGEEGYIVTSKGVGTLCYFRDKQPAEYRLPVYQSINHCTMPLFGVVRGQSAFAGIITSGQYDTRLCLSTNLGTKHIYSIDPELVIRSFKDEDRLPDDFTVQYHFLPEEEAGWVGIGRCYRKYNFENRDIKTLKERAEKSAEVSYSAGVMEVRLRLGVKPVPPEITEQTPETEPPVRVFLTFEKVRDIFDEFHRQGIGQAEFCLVGWNKGGHDGRYPQIFPVEPALGGEDELLKTISYGQSLGYQVVAHDCYYGAYRISEDWDEEYIRKKPDGELFKGGQWGGGQSYNVCMARAYDLFAKRDLPLIRELGFKGVHYSDVLSILGPRPCYDPRHPATRKQDAMAVNKILSLADEIFGGVQSEGSLDFTAAAMDRFLYIYNGEHTFKKVPYVDQCIPLYPVVYHGVLLYNVSHKTVNALPGEFGYLKNIEYGALPFNYFYGHFMLDKSKDWLGDRDFRYDSREGLHKAVSKLKEVYQDLQRLRHLQTEFIEDHYQLADSVFITHYSNDQSVIVNYNEDPFVLPSGREIPGREYILVTNNK